MQIAPLLTEGVEVGLIDSQSLGISLRDKLRLTRDGPYVLRILGFAQTHVVIAAHGVAEGLVVNVGGDVEVHATAYILDDEAIAAWSRTTEVDVPHIRTHEVLLTCLLLGIGSRFPEGHLTCIRLLLGVHIIEPDLTAFPVAVVALSAITQPLVEVSGMECLCGGIADDVDVDGLRLAVPDVETYAGRILVGTQCLRDADLVGAALSHGLRQLEEEPVVVLAGEGIVCVHGL